MGGTSRTLAHEYDADGNRTKAGAADGIVVAVSELPLDSVRMP